MKKPLMLKGMTIVENIVAFIIIIGVLVIAFTGLTISADYVQRGRDISRASDYATAVINHVSGYVTPLLNRLEDKSSDKVNAVISSNTLKADINSYKNNSSYSNLCDVELTYGNINLAEKEKGGQILCPGVYLTVKVLVSEDDEVPRYVQYTKFIYVS